MGKKNERQSRILSYLIDQKTQVSVKDLSAKFVVSEMTIRRDLDMLASNSMIDRSYGQAIFKSEADVSISNGYELNQESNRMTQAKERIGRFAASLIEQDDIVIIDNGSTADKVAEFLPDYKNITIVTYNYNVLAHAIPKQGVKIIFAGGYYHSNDKMFESEQGIKLIENIRANKLFLSAHGVHRSLGLTCGSLYETQTKRAVINSANNKILIVDSSKFGKITTAYFAELREVDTIITDRLISDEWHEYILSSGIKLHLV